MIWAVHTSEQKVNRLRSFRLRLEDSLRPEVEPPPSLITIKISVEGFVGDEKKLADEISRVLRQVEKDQ